MIFHDAKKTASVIMAKMGKPGETPIKPEDTIGESLDSFKAIAEDMLQAIHSGSAIDLAQSLKAAMAEYDAQDDQDDQDEPSGDAE